MLALAPLGAQRQGTADGAAPATAARELRVSIVGASVSAGFCDGPMFGAKRKGETIDLQKLLRGWADDELKITAHNPMAMLQMFLGPVEHGREQVDAARKSQPDLVVAIDFPFWFAYGYMDGSRDEFEQRSERLANGLAMLAELDVPTLLGDLPDMAGAAQRMIRPAQIPNPAMLQRLNEQIHTFVGNHPKCHLVALADVVDAMRKQGVALPLADGPLATRPLALQQEDRLHATRLGMAFLGCRLEPVLTAALPEGHALRTRHWAFEQWVEAAGAEDELDAIRAAAKGGDAKAGASKAGDSKNGAGTSR